MTLDTANQTFDSQTANQPVRVVGARGHLQLRVGVSGASRHTTEGSCTLVLLDSPVLYPPNLACLLGNRWPRSGGRSPRSYDSTHQARPNDDRSQSYSVRDGRDASSDAAGFVCGVGVCWVRRSGCSSVPVSVGGSDSSASEGGSSALSSMQLYLPSALSLRFSLTEAGSTLEIEEPPLPPQAWKSDRSRYLHILPTHTPPPIHLVVVSTRTTAGTGGAGRRQRA